MKATLKTLAGGCALALVLSGPFGPALMLTAIHAISDAHHHGHEGATTGHDHEGDSHRHEFHQAQATPATLTNAPSLDPVQTGRRSLVNFFAAPSLDGFASALAGLADTGPSLQPPRLLLSRKPADRAPPA